MIYGGKEILKYKLFYKIIIIFCVLITFYLVVSIYFINHFFINTSVNGVNLSLKSYDNTNKILSDKLSNFNIELIGRDGRKEIINGKELSITYTNKNISSDIKKRQNPFLWITALVNKNEYKIDGVIEYNKENLFNIVKSLDIVTDNIEEPINASFVYNDGSYEVKEEIYGNKLNEEKLFNEIDKSILAGERIINLEESDCYINPKYTSNSDKIIEVEETLNKYIDTKVTYLFGDKKEFLDASIIKNWILIDEELNVEIDDEALSKYIADLSKKYNTIGITRDFKSSTGKIVEVKGGFYGWKINSIAERKLLKEYITLGATIEKEPVYTQEAIQRGDDDIGNTYVEINISKQYLWFYKDGKVIAEGSVVTGDERKGYDTGEGTYMINYTQKDAILRGVGYESKVTYWMPFNGNIGIHDASWRNSFGYDIYKNNGTHGCVNTPLHLAKRIYENIEEGTPVICYKE